MLSVTLEQFMELVDRRSAGAKARQAQGRREKVLRPDQHMHPRSRRQPRRLATCPACDAVVDAEILHPRTGLCPICHEESFLR